MDEKELQELEDREFFIEELTERTVWSHYSTELLREIMNLIAESEGF